MPARRGRLSLLVAVVVTSLLASVMATGAVAANPRDPAAAHGRYIVRARTHADVAGLRQAAGAVGARVVGELSATDTLVVTGSSAAAAALAGDSRAATVVPDRIERIVPPEATGNNKPGVPHGDGGSAHKPGVTPDPAFKLPGLMWNVNRINAPQAWKTTTGSKAVTVGVADTGLDYTHSELATQVVRRRGLHRPEGSPTHLRAGTTARATRDADWAALYGGPANTDWNGHGSWIGGNIAAALDGVGINGIARMSSSSR